MARDSRLRIVEVLKRRRQASVTELSQALGLTPVTIRHHLDSLQADDIVTPPVPRRKAGPGRPEMVYSLTERADGLTPRNYGELCACLLQNVSSMAADSAALLDQAGSRLAADAGGRGGLRLALDFLEARGYFPSLEEDDGPVVILANCPYLEVARTMPAVCRFDLALLGGLLGRPVSAEARIVDDDPTCRMRVGQAPV